MNVPFTKNGNKIDSDSKALGFLKKRAVCAAVGVNTANIIRCQSKSLLSFLLVDPSLVILRELANDKSDPD